MKKIFLTVLAMVCFLTLGTSAWSLSITPTTNPQWTGTVNSSFSAADVATTVGYSGTLVEFYKQDVGGTSDEGSFASSYATSFSNSSADPSDAQITYLTETPYINATPLYLYVKDGNHDPAYYIFSLSTLRWNGRDTIELSGFWPDQGAISHLTIYGPLDVPPGQVPEPSVLLLLGVGLVGLAGYKKFYYAFRPSLRFLEY